MRIYLVGPDGTKWDCKEPFSGADHVVVKDLTTCPRCKHPAPVKIAGSEQRASSDNRAWEADAFTWCCKKSVGLLVVETNTLFGVTEDRAVLAGRWRVY